MLGTRATPAEPRPDGDEERSSEGKTVVNATQSRYEHTREIARFLSHDPPFQGVERDFLDRAADAIVEALVTALKSVTNSSAGADLVGMTVITETGAKPRCSPSSRR